ncbi:MAG: hypothetical protein JW829_14180 [Pirellulales bacterium]|nr:hypothetical protein [Pirellulales bacterium]
MLQTHSVVEWGAHRITNNVCRVGIVARLIMIHGVPDQDIFLDILNLYSYTWQVPAFLRRIMRMVV